MKNVRIAPSGQLNLVMAFTSDHNQNGKETLSVDQLGRFFLVPAKGEPKHLTLVQAWSWYVAWNSLFDADLAEWDSGPYTVAPLLEQVRRVLVASETGKGSN